MTPRAPAVVAVLALLCAPGAGAEAAGPVVAGRDRARIVAPAAAPIEPYENAGYRLRRVEGAWEVEVVASPLGSSSPFEAPASADGVVGKAALRIAAGSATRYEAVSRVLTWVARNIRYDLDRTASQDPVAVLGRRSAYCTGVARLTVALLGALGVEAREVPGWIAGDGREAAFHRWVEVLYPDRGWVFSDPLRSHHFVPATYVRLAGESLTSSDGDALEGRILGRDRRLDEVDLSPLGAEGVGLRANESRRRAAAVKVEVPGARGGWSRLEGGGLRRDLGLDVETAAFVGLAPGEYDLRVWTLDGWLYRRTVVLRGAERRVLHLTPTEVLRWTTGPLASADPHRWSPRLEPTLSPIRGDRRP